MVAVRHEDEAEKTEWWKTVDGTFELRDSSSGDVICSFDSIEDFDDFSAGDVPAFINKRKNSDRCVVEECDGDRDRFDELGEYDDESAAIQDGWKKISVPFIPEKYIPETDEPGNWWAIVYVPTGDDDGPLLEYTPRVTEDGDIEGEFRPLFDDAAHTAHRIPNPPMYADVFGKNTAKHWLLYLVDAWEDDESTEGSPTTSELHAYADGKSSIFDTAPHPHPFPSKQSISTVASKAASDDLVQSFQITNENGRAEQAYKLTERGRKLIIDAGIPSELPNRNCFDNREIEPVFDPRTKQPVEAVCSICGQATGSLTTHMSNHTDQSFTRYVTPVTQNTMGHWTLYAIDEYYDRYQVPATRNDLYDFEDGDAALGEPGAISTTLSDLYSNGLLDRERVDGQNKYRYRPSESGSEYIDVLGAPTDIPDRQAAKPEDAPTNPEERLG